MTRREQLLDRIRPVLVCPACRRGLADRGGDLACDAVLISRPAAHTIASGFASQATKPGGAIAR